MADANKDKELDKKSLEIIVSYKSGSSSNPTVNKELTNLNRKFNELLSKFPAEYKKVLEDKFIYRLTEQQIAKKFNMKLNEVEEIISDGFETYKNNIGLKPIDIPVKSKIENIAVEDKKIELVKQIQEPKFTQQKQEEHPQAIPTRSSEGFLRFIAFIIPFAIMLLSAYFLSQYFSNFNLNSFESKKTIKSNKVITDPNTIEISGSSSLSLISSKWQKNFLKYYPNYMINVSSNGSDQGIVDIIDGKVDIANSSRPLLYSDTHKAISQGVELIEHRVAIDALVIVVNKNNPIESLSIDQLENIFRGKSVNWNSLDGLDESILPIIRDVGSGTNSFVRNRILAGEDFDHSIKKVYEDKEIMKLVSDNSGGIGFINSSKYPWDMKNIKFISIKTYEDSDSISPFADGILNEDAIRYGDYPLSHYLYLITRSDADKKVYDYVDWVLSSEGQEVVRQLGLIPVQ